MGCAFPLITFMCCAGIGRRGQVFPDRPAELKSSMWRFGWGRAPLVVVVGTGEWVALSWRFSLAIQTTPKRPLGALARDAETGPGAVGHFHYRQLFGLWALVSGDQAVLVV